MSFFEAIFLFQFEDCFDFYHIYLFYLKKSRKYYNFLKSLNNFYVPFILSPITGFFIFDKVIISDNIIGKAIMIYTDFIQVTFIKRYSINIIQ